MKNGEPTNAQFAGIDTVFKRACTLAAVEPTKRQASKYRRKTGSAYNMKSRAVAELAREKAGEGE